MRQQERQRITMVTFRWIKMSLFLILMLQFTAAAVGQSYQKLTVRVGDDVSLPCYSVKHYQQNCERNTWLFTNKMRTVELFVYGQIHREAAAKSERLSVTANCSLVIKKVTDEDDGLYACRQFISGVKQGPDSGVILSVTNTVTRKHLSSVTVRVGDDVSLPCYSEKHYQQNCERNTWLFTNKMRTVTLFVYGQIYRDAAAKSERLSVTANCSLVIKKVTDEDDGRYTCRQFISGEQRPDSWFDLSVLNSKDEKTAKSTFVTSAPKSAATTKLTTTTKSMMTSKSRKTTKTATRPKQTTSAATTKTPTVTSTATTKTPTATSTATTKTPTATSADKQTSTTNNPSQQQSGQSWWAVIVSVGVAVFLIVGVVIVIWKKTKGNERKKEENPDNPEVSYASISYTKKIKKKSRVPDSVTYSTVRASSSSAGVSIDPNSIYITVN